MIKVLLPFALTLNSLVTQLPTPMLASVKSIHDGDTLTAINEQGKTIKIRLACIDAPELKQKDGSVSLAKLKSLIKTGDRLTIRPKATDFYGRTIAEVYSGQQLINLEMVRTGQAAVYTAYLSACNETRSSYLEAELSAKQKRLGMWKSQPVCFPWDFRRKKCN